MKQFFVTSTITIEADNREQADALLKDRIVKQEIASDLLRNAEIEEDLG